MRWLKRDPMLTKEWLSVLAFGVGLLILVVPLVLFIAWLHIDL